VGQLPVFTQVLLSIGGATLEPDDAAMARALDSLSEEATSEEPLRALVPLLRGRGGPRQSPSR
jgi:hypothetical protein